MSVRLPTEAFLLILGTYNCFGLADLDRTTIAPRHVIPAPRRYTAAEPPSGTDFLGLCFADATGARQSTATTASHHFRCTFFIKSAPFNYDQELLSRGVPSQSPARHISSLYNCMPSPLVVVKMILFATVARKCNPQTAWLKRFIRWNGLHTSGVQAIASTPLRLGNSLAGKSLRLANAAMASLAERNGVVLVIFIFARVTAKL